MPAAETKRDLLAAAEKAAASASESEVDSRTRYQALADAKTALEAANLVDTASAAAEVDQALTRLGQELTDAGFLAEYGQAESVEAFLRSVFATVHELRGRLIVSEALNVGYSDMREFLERLNRDFEGAGTETAARMAARVQGALDAAGERVTRARREVEV